MAKLNYNPARSLDQQPQDLRHEVMYRDDEGKPQEMQGPISRAINSSSCLLSSNKSKNENK